MPLQQRNWLQQSMEEGCQKARHAACHLPSEDVAPAPWALLSSDPSAAFSLPSSCLILHTADNAKVCSENAKVQYIYRLSYQPFKSTKTLLSTEQNNLDLDVHEVRHTDRTQSWAWHQWTWG